MSSPIRLARLLLVACALFVARPANGTPNFPGAVQRDLGASQAPPCSLCHLCGTTGRGTVNTPWGIAMRARGLVAFDEASLSAALAAMERDRVDSDADRTIDVDAVRMGKDPNPAGLCGEENDRIPRYGCVGRVSSAPPQGRAPMWLALAVLLAAQRRRSGRARDHRSVVPYVVMLAFVGGAAGACASGASLSPRPDPGRRPSGPRMLPLLRSEMAADLCDIGLDPGHLPPFGSLSGRKLERLMSTFTRSLGFACTDCHDPADYRAPTRAKRVTVQMWNGFTRPYAVPGSVLYCDSCHRGQGRFLDRRDKKAVSTYMIQNYTDKLIRHDRHDVECATCHGDPFEAHLLVP